MLVRVPASSANLGPGFDTLGMALSLHAEVGLGPSKLNTVGMPISLRLGAANRNAGW